MIEIIKDFLIATYCFNTFADDNAKVLSNKLIKAGVLLPKIKMGSTVWEILKDCDGSCDYYSSGYDGEFCDLDYDMKFPNIKSCEKSPYIESFVLTTDFYYGIGEKYLGVTWFATQAEAQAALDKLNEVAR